MDFKLELNDKQFEAVTTHFKHVRVVAGAGSGKTRVLTYRIAYLVGDMQIEPWKILAITFTNKVANEMKERLLSLLPQGSKEVLIKTFHSFAAYFLRHEIDVLGFPKSFSIMDEEDQTKLVKDIASELGYRRGDEIVKKAINYIGGCKLRGKYPSDIEFKNESFHDEKECLKIYELYESAKNRSFNLDFDDLLLVTNKILGEYPAIRIKWQNKIDAILVDEFQDTNDIEYRLLSYLKKPSTMLYVVGDPDQTIYTWRGANQKIILELEKEYKDIQTIVLERNYRSTESILNSANKLIANNKLRLPKNLYTENHKGTPIVINCSYSMKEEAQYIAREIKKLHDIEKKHYSDIAILYRSNYITMDFEQAFTSLQIPYRIYGGTKFYQRREIKEVLAYFHLIVNVKDDVSFDKIINVPKRGIGEISQGNLKTVANKSNKSLYEYVRDVEIDEATIPNKLITALKSMVARIDIARIDITKNEEVFSKTLENMIQDLGYYDYLAKEDDGESRLENVKALFGDLRNYLSNNPESSFDEYLQNISLLSAQDEIIDGDFVTLMTVHTAKGLEFPIVFIVRLNDGVFPNMRALLDGGYAAIEEERRLAYVAFTRAKERLYLSYASGYNYVNQSYLNPSQFIKESGNNIKEFGDNSYGPFSGSKKKDYHFDDAPHYDFSDNNFSSEKKKPEPKPIVLDNGIKDWEIGDIVNHKKLGQGTVIELEGDGIIKVKFIEHGVKSILGNHPAVSKGGKV